MLSNPKHESILYTTETRNYFFFLSREEIPGQRSDKYPPRINVRKEKHSHSGAGGGGGGGTESIPVQNFARTRTTQQSKTSE